MLCIHNFNIFFLCSLKSCQYKIHHSFVMSNLNIVLKYPLYRLSCDFLSDTRCVKWLQAMSLPHTWASCSLRRDEAWESAQPAYRSCSFPRSKYAAVSNLPAWSAYHHGNTLVDTRDDSRGYYYWEVFLITKLFFPRRQECVWKTSSFQKLLPVNFSYLFFFVIIMITKTCFLNCFLIVVLFVKNCPKN